MSDIELVMLRDTSERKIDRLRAALQFYAKKENYEQLFVPSKGFSVSEVLIDNGEKARRALGEIS
jgi:hypothetical protein